MDLGMPPATLALACLANLSELAVSLTLLVDWIRNWRHVKAYWAYGLGAGLGVLGFGILQIIAGALTTLLDWRQYLPPGWESSATPSGQDPLILLIVGLLLMVLGLLAVAVTVTRVAGFTMLGMHYADVLGHPSFPLLRRLYNPQPLATERQALPAAGGEGLLGPAAAGALEPPQPAAEHTVPPGDKSAEQLGGERRPLRGYVLSALGVAAAAIAYSVLLFRLASPRLSDVLTGLPGYTPETAYTITPAVLVTVLAAALSEELTYRLGIQGFLARYLNAQGSRYWLPVVLTALLWTLQHAGAMEPGWVKLAQVFPIGLMLGWLYRRHGVESCILAHALFNVGLAPFASFLIGT